MQKSNDRKKIFPFFAFLFFSFLLIFLNRFPIFKNFLGRVESPFLSLQSLVFSSKLKLVRSFKIWSSLKEISKKEEELKEKIDQYEIDAGRLAVCLEENEQMRKLLDAPLPPSWSFIPAKVIAGGVRLKINIGQKAGISPGLAVVSANRLVGKINEVNSFSSLVTPVDSPNLKITVVVRREKEKGIKARGLLVGLQEGNLLLKEVLKDEKISIGDLVYTSGEDNWPTDLLIGRIDKITSGKDQVFQEAKVEPSVDYQDLRNVFVVIP